MAIIIILPSKITVISLSDLKAGIMIALVFLSEILLIQYTFWHFLDITVEKRKY